MRFFLRQIAALLVGATLAGAAQADLTVGVSLSLTGPLSSLGIPQRNSFALWPDTIAGEKVKLVILDDATDPTTAVKNARKFATEDKADVILGSSSVPNVIAIAGVATELQVPQLGFAPIDLPKGKGDWTFILPQPISLMAKAVAQRMKADKVNTVALLAFNESYGEAWKGAFGEAAARAGLKVGAIERYAPPDVSVVSQALKVIASRPDAVLIVGAGTPAALPQITLRERGYKGRIYQTHGAASPELLRVGGASMEGVLMPAGPVLVAEQLPAASPMRAPGVEYVAAYEKKYGERSRSQFGAHAWDALMVLQRVVPVALKQARPGTPEFRKALRAALESEKELVITHGVLNYSADNHGGFDDRGVVMLTVEKGQFKLLK
jgi:branched-chain amino acid transport system substrate-binding protein